MLIRPRAPPPPSPHHSVLHPCHPPRHPQVDVIPESLLGIAGLVDDLIVAIVLLLHITTVYRTILLSWERSRASRAAAAAAGAPSAAAAASSVPPWQGSLVNSPMGSRLAGVAGLAVGTAGMYAGAGGWVVAFVVGVLGAGAVAMASAAVFSWSSGARAGMPPPLARDW